MAILAQAGRFTNLIPKPLNYQHSTYHTIPSYSCTAVALLPGYLRTRSWTRYAGSDPKQLAHHLHLCLHLLLLHYLPGYLRSYWQFELVAELESPASPISITTALLLLLSVGKSSYQVYTYLGKFFNFLRLLATASLGNPKW